MVLVGIKNWMVGRPASEARVYRKGVWEEERRVGGRKKGSGLVRLASFPCSFSLPMKKTLVTRAWLQEPGYKTREIGRESKPNRSKEMLTICSNPKVAFMESNFLMHVAQCMGECSHGVSDPQAIQVWLFLASGSLLFIFSSLYFM